MGSWFNHEGIPQTLYVRTVRFTSLPASVEGGVKPGICLTVTGCVPPGKQLQAVTHTHTVGRRANQSLARMRFQSPSPESSESAGVASVATKNPAARLGF